MTIRSRVPPLWTTCPPSHVNPRRRQDVEQLDVATEVFLFDPISDSMMVLNTTAGQVWHLCDGTRAIEDVIVQLAADFNLPADEVATAVRSAVQDLLGQGLLMGASGVQSS